MRTHDDEPSMTLLLIIAVTLLSIGAATTVLALGLVGR